LVSVVVANHNYARYLAECIESVLGQTYANLELIVVDDGSTDSSVEVARRYERRDGRVRLITQRNRGQAAAMNAGFAASSGRIVCFLDSDDYWMSEKVARVVEAFAAGDYALVQHHHRVVDERSRPTGATFPRAGLTGDILERYLTANHTSYFSTTSGLACRREHLERLFPLDERWRICADVALSRPLPVFGQVFSFEEPLGYYRVHAENRWHHHPRRQHEVANALRHAAYANRMLARFGVEGRIKFRRSETYRQWLKGLPGWHPAKLRQAAAGLIERLRRLALLTASRLLPRAVKRPLKRILGRAPQARQAEAQNGTGPDTSEV
jgi:glycosyltransferase involved in cell wall biosynthesis